METLLKPFVNKLNGIGNHRDEEKADNAKIKRNKITMHGNNLCQGDQDIVANVN